MLVMLTQQSILFRVIPSVLQVFQLELSRKQEWIRNTAPDIFMKIILSLKTIFITEQFMEKTTQEGQPPDG